jgi:filamentous hemagglutinin family protein
MLICSLTIGVATAFLAECASAQIQPDNTLGSTEQSVVTQENINGIPSDKIEGGATRGVNLFHSLQEFNINADRGAYFNNPSGIENIFSRVTGKAPSQILGKLGVLGGNANLYLLNPNGIIFGANASLDVRGSFVGTTASAIQFEDRGFFSASIPNQPGLLTVNPSALLFNQMAAGSITSSSIAPAGQRLDPLPSDPSAVRDLFGLRVPDSRSLLLVGGNVSVDGGVSGEVSTLGGGLNALGGRIELAGVAGMGAVGLDIRERNISLSFPKDIALADISFTNRATVDTSSDRGGGDILLQGKNIVLASSSRILSTALGANPGGNLTVNASDSIALLERSGLVTTTESVGVAGDLTINTRHLIVANGTQVLSSTASEGTGGNLTINALESVELSGTSQFGIPSSLSTATAATGNAGNLTISTKRLIIQDGAEVSTRSFGIEDEFGNLTPATGRGGNLTVNVSESVNLSGTSPDGSASGLFAGTIGAGNAGNINIHTGDLTILNSAEVAVSSEGTGNAGNLEVTANSIRVENGGKLTATSELSSDGGNINLQNLDLLTLRNNGEISTTAKGAGNGGNINIDTNNLVVAERSKITARAVDGRGGNINITTQGLFVSPDSTIDATSDRGINGIVEIRRPDVDPSAELVILPADVVDISGLIAQGCSAAGGVASGESSFAITGRGGLPPTPAEATRSESILADLGITEKSKVKSQKSKTISTTDSRLPTPPETSNKVNPTPLVEATGWVVGSNGEVILTAAVTNDTLNIPWFRPHRCNGT